MRRETALKLHQALAPVVLGAPIPGTVPDPRGEPFGPEFELPMHDWVDAVWVPADDEGKRRESLLEGADAVVRLSAGLDGDGRVAVMALQVGLRGPNGDVERDFGTLAFSCSGLQEIARSVIARVPEEWCQPVASDRYYWIDVRIPAGMAASD